MTNHHLWTDDLWPLLLQIYMRKPAGIKPMFSRDMVELALELHIPPGELYAMMFELRRTDVPHIAALWRTYGDNPKKLGKAASRVRRMRAFCTGGAFFDGVETNETFERDFRTIDGCQPLTPVMLVIILDLFFRLTPATMVTETPEIRELAKMLGLEPETVVRVMRAFCVCDPYLMREPGDDTVMEDCCRETWNRYGNGNPEVLAATAAQLAEYFKTAKRKVEKNKGNPLRRQGVAKRIAKDGISKRKRP